jgi:hypothetical protein
MSQADARSAPITTNTKASRFVTPSLTVLSRLNQADIARLSPGEDLGQARLVQTVDPPEKPRQ